MRYLALACDYDGTIAHNGQVDAATLKALQELRKSGRKLILVTGRELPELLRAFTKTEIMDLIVVENGALLYDPHTKREKVLGPPPPEEFVRELQRRNVPISVGRSIVATWEPHETTAMQTIHDLGLELQIIFNKGAVMILPSGVNKASGLKHALRQLGFSAHNVVGVGDAENDHAFLNFCECAAVVRNALPALKQKADLILKEDHGQGVVELVGRLLEDDLAEATTALPRHQLELGTKDGDQPFQIPPYGVSLLVAGPPGGGKSTFATAFIERLIDHQYQFCVIDPEGDYEELENAVVLGDARRAPAFQEIFAVLTRPGQNCVANLVAVPLQDRPAFFAKLLADLTKMRSETGRPHWVIVDETHHLLPSGRDVDSVQLPQRLPGFIFITAEPEGTLQPILQLVDLILMIGRDADALLEKFGRALGLEDAELSPSDPAKDGASLAWWRRPPSSPFRFHPHPPSIQRKRHVRKYAEGELPPDRRFHFRGPDGKLNLQAQNVMIFLQMADGVDDATWMYHLRNGDYAKWFRQRINDPALAAAIDSLARRRDLTPSEGRARLHKMVAAVYTSKG